MPWSPSTKYTVLYKDCLRMLAISCSPVKARALEGSLAALRMSYVATSSAELNRPVRISTNLGVMVANAASKLPSMTSIPAAANMFIFFSLIALACCLSRNITAAAETMTEQTTHSTKATKTVLETESFKLDMTCNPPLNICFGDIVVNQRGKQIGK